MVIAKKSVKLPFNLEEISKIIQEYPTPFHIYDEQGIRENARKFKAAFGKLEGFKEYFAVKALPNPFILKILKSEGFGTDCSSLPDVAGSYELHRRHASLWNMFPRFLH